MRDPIEQPTIETHGWCLRSAEERAAASPRTFAIPPRSERESLQPGAAAKLLFDIETRADGHVVDRGVDRMWVIVNAVVDGRYVGVLDSDPGQADNLRLQQGDMITFAPDHVCDIAVPPRDYIVERYGEAFFG